MLPCAGDCGQHGNGADGGAAVLRALHTVVQAQCGGTGGCIFAGELLNFCCGHAGPGSYSFGRVLARTLGQSGKAMGYFVDVGAVFEPLVQNHVHHSECECGVGSRADGNMPVGEAGRAGLIGVDDDQAGAVAAGLLDHGPEMDVVAVDICAPGQN